ncbi:hypothetical protein VNO77_36101 [Canavalia gladiata]|uniref:DUF4408 domain-containing protein n=1 Tax=Canavalia gladiata TaxID=3824 RepID=A0AAN9K8V2_CANGL
MDSFSFNNLQSEKANAILKHRKLRRVASLLRLVEVCAVLIFISRFSLQLPVAVRSSSEYFRDLSLFMNSPRFVFLIGNLIIITLFAQSGQFSAQASRRNVQEPDLYQELVQNSTNRRIKTEDEIENRRILESDAVADYSKKNLRIDAAKSKRLEKQRVKTEEVNIGLEKKEKDYRRCHTEILSEKRRRLLRRCDTENNRKNIEGEPARISYPQDDMSNEEFRRTVEAFIARQQRIRREEDYYLL